LPALVRRVFPEEAQGAVRDADEICAHVFDILGSGKTRLGPEIDWHRDFKSGFSWALRARCDSGGRCSYPGADIKVPWDLSSFLHLPALGKAYWFTGDPKYAREFREEAESWFRRNPRPRGINWACTMKVAHRVLNWAWGRHFFRAAPELADGFWERFLAGVEEHGQYIRRHLEDERPATNHYLLSLAALLYLGAGFPEIKVSGRWMKFALKQLHREMEVQVCPDGVDYEGSIYYHHFAVEIFLSAMVLGEKNGLEFSSGYRGRLEKMLEFVLAYSRPGGSAPRIGDQDDGRVQVLSDYSDWGRFDHRRLLSTGSVVFGRGDFKAAAEKFHEESLWLLGGEGMKRFAALPAGFDPPVSRAFPAGGFYIMRKNDLHLIADCLPHDPEAPRAHRHNSRLSFEISALGTDFIVDPGTSAYTADPARRDLFRSTAFHNTVTVDGREQNPFRGGDPWSFRSGGTTRVLSWETGEEYDLLIAEYLYRRRKPFGRRLAHRRQIFFSKNEGFWVIRDVLRARGRHVFCSRFHFHPLVRLSREPGTVLAEREGKELRIRLLGPGAGEGSFEIREGRFSERYGLEAPASVLARSGSFTFRLETALALVPGPVESGKFTAAAEIYSRLSAAGRKTG